MFLAANPAAVNGSLQPMQRNSFARDAAACYESRPNDLVASTDA
ncbi:MAG: hypothetical protein AVDCRST_MAG42-3360 [uncultured Chthoniobacterales bacterium]|uniref:Uncharacterized protein n=1 Tax=uncultured Chthoniobacterales bacterium TaxID=1836801 RepID=A0A6J4J5I7_9BACT|nr:MAG: hypothetical protein AVDCRST_MAG42-3360 [uncultured Chthoniobacterales bacterium]